MPADSDGLLVEIAGAALQLVMVAKIFAATHSNPNCGRKSCYIPAPRGFVGSGANSGPRRFALLLVIADFAIVKVSLVEAFALSLALSDIVVGGGLRPDRRSFPCRRRRVRLAASAPDWVVLAVAVVVLLSVLVGFGVGSPVPPSSSSDNRSCPRHRKNFADPLLVDRAVEPPRDLSSKSL